MAGSCRRSFPSSSRDGLRSTHLWYRGWRSNWPGPSSTPGRLAAADFLESAGTYSDLLRSPSAPSAPRGPQRACCGERLDQPPKRRRADLPERSLELLQAEGAGVALEPGEEGC